MEITPELIANYEFSTSMRGFDADEVNDFLEKVGTELAKAQHQVRKATERIATLEAELANAQTQAANSGNAADVDARRAARALMAAQETADRIEATAAAEAAEVTAAAEREAAALRASIEAEAAAARSSAESEKARIEAEHAELAATLKASALAEADAASGARIAELDEQIGSMTNLSADLQSDVAALQQRVSGYRGLIESMATMFRELLDDEDALYTQPDLELRVAVPPTARPGVVVAPVAAPASDEWERGTWSQDLASEVETPEAEFDDEGEYPLGAETTEVAVVDIDEYVEEDVVDEPTAAHEEVISERDPTLAEGWQNPFDSAEDIVPQPDVWGSAEPVVPVEEESYEPADTWGGRAVEDDVSDFDSHPAASFSDEPVTAGVDAVDLAYTAEFDALDLEAVAGDESSEQVPHQLQAFAGEVDVFQTSPYVPKQVFGDESDGHDLIAPPMDMADGSFGGGFNDPGYDLDTFRNPPLANVGDEFDFSSSAGSGATGDAYADADFEDVAFDDSAFGQPYSGGDRYLQELDDAVNRNEVDLDSLNAFLTTSESEPETPKRRFRRR